MFGALAPKNAFSSIDPTIQWNLVDVGIENAWNYTQGNPDIVVAVIDSGIDFTHQDLENQSWTNPNEIPGNGMDDDNNGYIDDIVGWDFRDDDNDPSPGHKHGTFVAGLIAADDDNDICVGIAPNVKLMSLRFLDDQNKFGGEDWDIFEEAIRYATQNGGDIIHMSIQACGIPPNPFYDAIKDAYEMGIPIVSVTGNIPTCGKTMVHYPGNYTEVIAVSATNQTRGIASFSCYGGQNEISAPGDNVFSIYPDTWTPQTGSGTSFSAPLVSGAIALILSLNHSLSIETVRSILHETSIDLGATGKDSFFGYGLLNVSAALEKVVIEYNKGKINSNETKSSTSSTTIASSTINGSILSGIIGILTPTIFLHKRRLKKSGNR
ncbi:MAG: S8 family serine peptidase [Candidatus Heimdallarchaeota archaeon]|nr:MAG: S8 family serine peptidase [Candidatus Heimdallarchaeota archaeon]